MCHKSIRSTCVLAAGILIFSSCSDSGGELRPCPPKGLGVEDFDGVTRGDQILQSKQYACSEPQICSDLPIAPIAFPFPLPDEGDEPTQISVGITNCSTGNKSLILDSVVLYGDSRCSFTCSARRVNPDALCEVNVEKTEIAPGETVTIATLYYPTAIGEDHAQFRIASNAQNFRAEGATSSLIGIPMCTRVTLPATLDGGVSADAEATASDAGSGGETLVCKPVNTVNSQCHADAP